MGAAMLNRLIAGATLRVLHGSISARELAAGAVSQAKLVEEFVGEVVLRPRSVTTAKFADGAVTQAKLAANAVQREHLAANTAGDGMAQNVDGSLSPLPDDATLELDAGALQIKADGVGTSQLADYSVAGGLAADAVETENLRTGAVTSEKIVDEAVTQAKLAAGAYEPREIGIVSGLTAVAAGLGELVRLDMNMSALRGQRVLALFVVRIGKGSYSAGSVTVRMRHYLSAFDGGGDAIDEVLHAVSVPFAANYHSAALAAAVTLRDNAAVKLRMTFEVTDGTGAVIHDITHAVFQISKRQQL